MAKKQTRRSISISRSTYERLKAFCEIQGISMSQVVEGQIGGLLGSIAASGDGGLAAVANLPPSPVRPTPPRPASNGHSFAPARPAPVSTPRTPIDTPTRVVSPMTSQAARHAVEPPPPIIKPREPVDAKPPTPPTADQIFTF